MLIDQEHCNVIAFLGEALEGPLDLRRLDFGINNQEVSLRVWSFGNML
jgi:hypothetical protein